MAEIQPNWSALYKPNANLILQGNPALDMLRQTYNTQLQQRAKDDADFNSNLAKLNFGGSKDADMDHLHSQYQDILGTHQQLRAANDPKQRNALDLELKQKMNGLMYDISLSKENHSEELKKADLVNNPNANMADDFQSKWTGVNKTSSFDPSYHAKNADLANNMFAPKGDPIKDAQEIKKSLENTKTATTEGVNKTTGSLERTATTTQDLDHDAFMKSWVATHIKDPSKIKLAIQATGEQDPAKAVTALGEQMYDAVGGKKESQKVTGGGLTMASRYALQDNAARLKSLYPTFQQGQNLTPIYRQKWISDMLHGVPESGEALVNKIKADPSFNNELGIKVNGDNITFTIPDKRKYDAKNSEYVTDQPSRKVTINKKDPNADVQLNELVNQLTGEKVDISSLRTQGGKKHVGTAPSYQHTQSAKDSKGNVVTLGYKDGKWYNTKTGQVIE